VALIFQCCGSTCDGTWAKAYDAVAWTGSNLCTWETEDPLVRDQVQFCRRVYTTGLPQFGSCWGLQLSAAAVGIPTEANPKGREQGFGFGGRTTFYESPLQQQPPPPLSKDGHPNVMHLPKGPHPFYHGKDPTFRGLAAHNDQVSVSPSPRPKNPRPQPISSL
jgi:GMP synthase-like glutamine amidotransferase